MSISEPLSAFFSAIATDPRISITHIGIYAALLQYWKEHDYENPLYVFSYEIMHLAKISSGNTYYRCMRDLSACGYIKYEASYKRTKGSKVYISNGL